jgi:Pyridine nucleotide-disulphide oxidoreductase
MATGARPRILPGLEPDKKMIWTYFEAMVPERMPKSLLVVGSGAIGIEFASFYHMFDGSSGGRGRPMALQPSQVLTSPILRMDVSSSFTSSLIPAAR